MQPIRIATVGGGTGTRSLTAHLKNQKNVEITAVVAVTDMGGSSEILRNDYEIIAVGDLRNVISSLIPDSEPDLQKGMEYRPKSNNGNKGFLDGHPVGNVRLASYIKMFNGDLVKAINLVMKECRAGHVVLPVTADSVQLCALLSDGSKLKGEGLIDRRPFTDKRKIVDVALEPKAKILLEAKKAFSQADIIVVCPGSPFTSIVPNFCVEGVSEVIRGNKKAIFVGVVNLVTNRNESPGWTASRHVSEIWRKVGRTFDYVICNDASLSDRAHEAYLLQGSEPVDVDERELSRYTHEIILGDFVEERKRGAVRHNKHLASEVVKLVSRRSSELV